MTTEITVSAESRTCSGSTAARRLRRSGIIPGVLNIANGESTLIQLNAHKFERVLSQHTGTQIIVSLEVDDLKKSAILREIQRDGLTGRIIHADFNEIDMTEEINVQIEIQLVGEPDGVRNQNGVLAQILREVEVTCLPSDAMDAFVVDVSKLKLGEDITVGELKLAPSMTLISDPEEVIATITKEMEEIPEDVVDEDEDDDAAQPEISVQKGKVEDDDAPVPGANK